MKFAVHILLSNDEFLLNNLQGSLAVNWGDSKYASAANELSTRTKNYFYYIIGCPFLCPIVIKDILPNGKLIKVQS